MQGGNTVWFTSWGASLFCTNWCYSKTNKLNIKECLLLDADNWNFLLLVCPAMSCRCTCMQTQTLWMRTNFLQCKSETNFLGRTLQIQMRVRNSRTLANWGALRQCKATAWYWLWAKKRIKLYFSWGKLIAALRFDLPNENHLVLFRAICIYTVKTPRSGIKTLCVGGGTLPDTCLGQPQSVGLVCLVFPRHKNSIWAKYSIWA